MSSERQDNSIETDRLLIRAFVHSDLPAIHEILNEAFGEGNNQSNAEELRERTSWLEWSILNQEWFVKMHQFPYGDRAIILQSTGELVGSIGYVPVAAPFGQIPELGFGRNQHYYSEVGLFWVVGSQYRNNGYATEAARAMIAHAFNVEHLGRIVAMTEFSNEASQAVMRKAGMTLAKNPQSEPPWLQIVGVLER